MGTTCASTTGMLKSHVTNPIGSTGNETGTMSAARNTLSVSFMSSTESVRSSGSLLTSWRLKPVMAGSALFSLMMSLVQCAPEMLVVV